MAVSTVGNWSANFLVSFTFLTLISAIGRAGTFWVYAGIGAFSAVYFFLRVPETKDRTLEEIEHELGADGAQDSGREHEGRFSRARSRDREHTEA
jgi:hypothetical protein